jgi:hypothetical protein
MVGVDILLGEKERASELMLETPSDHPAFYIDSLKACLLAATINNNNNNNNMSSNNTGNNAPAATTTTTTTMHIATPFKTTMKLVASNLIAHGYLDEGVQLLCLLDSQSRLDAARYLQTYDRWADAAWLIKVSPHATPADVDYVLSRWANYLLGERGSGGRSTSPASIPLQQQRIFAFELLLSLARWTDLLPKLATHQRSDVAALLARACQLRAILPKDAAFVSEVNRIYLEFGHALERIGLVALARQYYILAETLITSEPPL